jgi:transcriptional regulator with XRE-family HTH domain
MILLQKLRIDALQTPEQLAAECGVHAKTIRRLEAGASPQMATLAKLSTHFGVAASELMQPVERQAA